MKNIEEIQKEIDRLKVELVMGAYNNGWLNREYKKRLHKLELQLYEKINKGNDIDNIFDSES